MHRMTTIVVLALALSAGATEAAKPASTGKPTTKTQAPKAGSPKGAPVKSSTAKTTSVKTKSGPTKASTTKSAKATKTDTRGAGAATKAAKADRQLAKADQQTKKTKSDESSASSETSLKKKGGSLSATTTSGDTIDFTATALGQKLQKNSVQASKIEAKLLAAGYTGTVYEAAYGFKNLGQLNAATNQVQNHGMSFELLKVMMTGTYVDPETHVVYRANRLADGTVQLVSPELATNPAGSLSLGQSKQAIAGGAEMPAIVLVEPETDAFTAASTQRRPVVKRRKRP